MRLVLVKVLTVIVLLLGATLGASPADAAGLGVTPGRLAFSVRPGGTELQTIYIINQDDRVSDFEVYPEVGYEWLTVTPGRFSLGGYERRGVAISLAPPLSTDPGTYDLNICVVSMPPGGDLRIGAGVKVPARVQVTDLPVMSMQWWLVAAIILGVLAAGTGILWWRRRRYG
jgi:hypothetical protein